MRFVCRPRAFRVAALSIASPILPILYGSAGRFDIDARLSGMSVLYVFPPTQTFFRHTAARRRRRGGGGEYLSFFVLSWVWRGKPTGVGGLAMGAAIWGNAANSQWVLSWAGGEI